MRSCQLRIDLSSCPTLAVTDVDVVAYETGNCCFLVLFEQHFRCPLEYNPMCLILTCVFNIHSVEIKSMACPLLALHTKLCWAQRRMSHVWGKLLGVGALLLPAKLNVCMENEQPFQHSAALLQPAWRCHSSILLPELQQILMLFVLNPQDTCSQPVKMSLRVRNARQTLNSDECWIGEGWNATLAGNSLGW